MNASQGLNLCVLLVISLFMSSVLLVYVIDLQCHIHMGMGEKERTKETLEMEESVGSSTVNHVE